MAAVSGSQLSEEKRAASEPSPRQRRPWDDLRTSGKIGLTAVLPETLGFYDIDAVRRERQEQAAGNRWRAGGRTPDPPRHVEKSQVNSVLSLRNKPQTLDAAPVIFIAKCCCGRLVVPKHLDQSASPSASSLVTRHLTRRRSSDCRAHLRPLCLKLRHRPRGCCSVLFFCLRL